MASPLTGDHDAVLQLSVGTLNRLMASMHQNEVTPDPVLPCLPHSAFVRMGDDPAKRIDGVQTFNVMKGGEYLFMPSLSALQWLSTAGWHDGQPRGRQPNGPG